MFIGYFTERPYQDPKSGYFGRTSRPIDDLSLSNGSYDSELAADLYNRYFDEKIQVEEVGFDGVMLNEHHSTPFCMGGAMNAEAAILARITKKLKIVLLGNVLPIWEDPLWLAETLAVIDTISRGRLVAGWVRGTGRESISHNSQAPYNWERFQEAHEFIIKAWTTPGPFRWEGKHFQYRYVNPWASPYQKPHPQVWIPGILSRNTVRWAAEKRYPYVMMAADIDPTMAAFGYYKDVARENGYESGSQNVGYLVKAHVDETEELADYTARKYIQGPSNPFLEGNQGTVRPFIQNLPGLIDRRGILPTGNVQALASARGLDTATAVPPDYSSFENQVARSTIITGTPKTIVPKLRLVLERVRPGSIFFWDGDGAMDHDDAARGIRLWGEVIPELREIAAELELNSPYEVDPATGKPPEA